MKSKTSNIIPKSNINCPKSFDVKGFQKCLVLHVIFLLMVLRFEKIEAQEIYNSCNNALELCPGEIFNVNNKQANKTVCPSCEDDFTFCFTTNNTIWLKFTTNSTGGDVNVNFTNLVFENNPGQDNAIQASMIQTNVPCNSAAYTAIGNCVSNASTSFSLNTIGLAPLTEYYIVINGDLSGVGINRAAECTFDVSISGSGVNRIPPSISLINNPTPICANSVFSVQTILNDCPDTSSFQWFINGNLIAVTNSPFFQTSSLKDQDIISVQTTCYNLCPIQLNAQTNNIDVYSIYVDAGPDLEIETGETIQLQGNTTASNFSWTPSFYISDTLSLTPFVYPPQTLTYTLTATENGCTSQDYITVSLVEKLVFPTTFSPNNDGVNDTWQISGIDQYPNCNVKIFTRWGQEVFESTGYSKNKTWNGSKNGHELSEGVYFYVVELRDEDKREFKGSISLIR